MSLTTLPCLVLDEIASKLDFTSLVNLATSSTDLAHLQPKEQQVSGEDFSIHQDFSDGHFCPKTYFDVEVVTRGLVGVKMAWEWKDQGWGNQKGQVWLQLVRNNKVLEDNREEYFALAPHIMQRGEVLIDLHPIVTRAKRGGGGEVGTSLQSSFQKLLSGFFPFPTPLAENHFSKKPLAEMGGTPSPP